MVFRLNHGVAAVRQEAKLSIWLLLRHNRRKDNALKRMG
jgi:hypothetical protein